MRRPRLLLLSFALLAACSATPSAGARAQEVAQEMNVNTRFGRMELAVEHVAAKEREEYARRHKEWHGKLRIADLEMAGVKQITETAADVHVRVAWYRVEEQELRVTTVRQRWEAVKGEWMLVGEQRVDGDAGLLAEPPAKPGPEASPEPSPRRRAQFQTIRIGAAPASD